MSDPVRYYLPVTIEDFKALPEEVQNSLVDLIAYAVEGTETEPKPEQTPKVESLPEPVRDNSMGYVQLQKI